MFVHCHYHVIRIIISLLLVCSPLRPSFPISHLGMGGDVWMRRLGPVAPWTEGADWMHFSKAAAALRYLHSPDGGSLTKLALTQVMRAAKSDGTRDGWAFTLKKPASSSGASDAPPPSSSRATPSLSPFLLVPVRCACCGANICGTKYSCRRCHKVVDEACMTMVGSTVHCFSCRARVTQWRHNYPKLSFTLLG